MRKTEFNWQRDWLAAQVKAAPDPAARGAFDSEMALIGMVLGVCGGPGYQSPYKPGYGSGAAAGGPAYGSTYFGAGGDTYVSVDTGGGGGMSSPISK